VIEKLKKFLRYYRCAFCYIKTDTQYLPPAAAVGGIMNQADKPINPNDKKVYVLALVAGAFNCDN
jgi:hypothetical protein